MIQDVFFAIARETDFDVLAQRWVEAVFRRHRYEWPQPGQTIPIRELSLANKLDETLLQREVLRWLTAYIMQDREMAQDFRAVFGLGEDDTHISTVDADGVALAAIQGLYTVVKEKDDEIATLRGELTAMKAQQQSASEELKAIRAQLAGQR